VLPQTALSERWDTANWRVIDIPVPQQLNGVDCGVAAAMYANRLGLAGGVFDFGGADMVRNLRVAIACDLLGGRISATAPRDASWRQQQQQPQEA
jgi:Ulp1 family protease